MGTNIYALSSGNENDIKIWYPLSMTIGMEMKMNFFWGSELSSSLLLFLFWQFYKF